MLSDIKFFDQPEAVLKNVDFLVIATEWEPYRSPDFGLIKSSPRNPVIFDGRNIYSPNDVGEHGFEYVGIKRKSK